MAAVAVLVCFALYAAGYVFYSRFLAARVFALRRDAITPAHALEDGIDYVPTHRFVLFGHHYASITGLSPMLGPAIAVIWGWLPAMLWVVLGALLVGCVHDFGALVVSARARGKSIGMVGEGLIGPRAKWLLHGIIFFGISLAMGVFVFVIATLFRPVFYPQAVLPSAVILVLALAIGWLVRRRGANLWALVALAFAVVLLVVVLSPRLPVSWDDQAGWTWVLLAYAWLASVLPVWSLLQPRDFLNSLLLYLGLGAIYLGFFVLRPEFAAPAIDTSPAGAPPMFPFVFIVIACGAASGFHSLVSSGTTAKQLDRETDARPIGYGGMIGESLLGLAAVLACTAGFLSAEDWSAHYGSWASLQGLGEKMSAFVEGSARFVATLGVPVESATTLIAVVVVSFALTTLDSATRLLRYNLEEIGEGLKLAPMRNRYVSSSLAVAAIGFFAFYEIDGRAAGLALWQLFGSTNQLLAGLALLVVSLYLVQRGRIRWPYLIPMLFMMASTLVAMGVNLVRYYRGGEWLLLTVGGCITIIAVWLVIEAVLALRRYRRKAVVRGLEVALLVLLLVGCAEQPSVEEAEIDRLRGLPYAGSSAVAEDEGSGVVHHDAERSWPGLTLTTVQMLSMAELIDERGEVIRSWRQPGSARWERATLLPDGDLLAIGADRPAQPVRGIPDESRYLARYDRDGELLWKRSLKVHHDVIPDGRGGLTALAFRRRRLPEVQAGSIDVRDDLVLRLDSEGRVLEELSLLEAFGGPDPVLPLRRTAPNSLGVVPWIDPFHANSLRRIADPRLDGDLLICMRHQDAVAVIDRESRRATWAWGRGQLQGPHDARLLDNGNLLVFDNGIGRGWSRVVEVDPASGRIVWEYRGSPPESFFTLSKGSSQRLPNGNTLIAESDRGRAFEVTREGDVVWDYRCPHEVAPGQRAAIVRAVRYDR